MANKVPENKKLIFRCKLARQRLVEYQKLKEFFGVESDDEMIKLLIHRYYDQTGDDVLETIERPEELHLRSTITGVKAREGLSIKGKLGVETNKELLHVVIKKMYDRVY